MPKLFQVTFKKEFTVLVTAEDGEEMATAASEACAEIDRDWAVPEWECTATELRALPSPQAKIQPDLGVVDGSIVHIDDYRSHMRALEEMAKAEPVSVPLPGQLGMLGSTEVPLDGGK